MAEYEDLLSIFDKEYLRNVNARTDGRTDGGQRPTLKLHLRNQFHHDWVKNVTSRVHVFQRTGTIETSVLTKWHENWAKNVTFRVFTCFHLYIKRKLQPSGVHVFLPIWTIFELVRDVNKTNVLTNHVFQRTRTIFELNSRIYETNVLTKSHEDWTKNVTSRVLTCFHYIHIANIAPPLDINKTNVLTKFHDDWANIVTSRVFIRKTAPPTGGHVCQRTKNILTNFELDRDIIGTNLLTKFHEDRTRNAASRVFTTKVDGRTMDGRTYDGQRPIPKAHLSNQVS
ncbi:hypothetical protein DPMN_029169 [Dreissena polymorpha]|uniref:Uncharacterized protein n=1 Tax=Dreissena polymorpha TaxID=45954 RepID=A0A9D4RH49_DREPO|nr:hypothetical protein DPMN_029169 [Dreissena polymorpha]